MQKGIILYNYTAEGLNSLLKAVQLCDRPGCDLYAYYFPQNAINRNLKPGVESVSRSVLKDHFESIERRISTKNCRLFLGGSIRGLTMLQSVVVTGGYDFIMAGYTGNDSIHQAFIGKDSFSKLQKIVAIHLVQRKANNSNILLVSNSASPFSNGYWNFLKQAGQRHTLYHIRNSTELASQDSTLEVNQIFIAKNMRQILMKVLNESWNSIFVELSSNSDLAGSQKMRLTNLAYKKGKALHFTTERKIPVWREIQVQIENTY